MPKIQYKAKSGVLHIGGGRFFYAQEPVEVKEDDKTNLISTYKDLEEVEPEQEASPTDDESGRSKMELHTKSTIKKLSADEQRDLITNLGGNPEDTNNEEERIALILALQEEQTGE